MPRSIWKGAISFGLINVAVKMYSAVSRKNVKFHQLHDKDGVRIKYLVPDKAAAKSYTLLHDALAESNKLAIARVVMRTKEHLAAMRATSNVIALSTMLFHDEVVNPGSLDELPNKAPKITDKEVKMARQLLEALSTEFDPSQYVDTYRERVLDLIQAKAEGEEIAVPPIVAPRATKAPDLMKVLEESIAAAQGLSKSKKKTPARSRGTSHSANGKASDSSLRAKARSKPKPKAKSKA